MSSENSPEWRADVRDDLAILQGRDLGVVFRKLGDRWTDAIGRPGTAIELARALIVPPVAGESGRVANPVYQEVQLHGPANGPSLCLLLTGLSDDHHFSAAVTLGTPPDDPSALLIDFDIADRCRSPVASLAATYVVDLDSGALESADTARIAWSIASTAAGCLEVVAGPDCSLAMAEAGRKATRVQIVATIRPGTFTHRLRYGWRWTSAEGRTR